MLKGESTLLWERWTPLRDRTFHRVGQQGGWGQGKGSESPRKPWDDRREAQSKPPWAAVQPCHLQHVPGHGAPGPSPRGCPPPLPEDYAANYRTWGTANTQPGLAPSNNSCTFSLPFDLAHKVDRNVESAPAWGSLFCSLSKEVGWEPWKKEPRWTGYAVSSHWDCSAWAGSPISLPRFARVLWSLCSSQLADRETVVCAFVHFSGVNTTTTAYFSLWMRHQ